MVKKVRIKELIIILSIALFFFSFIYFKYRSTKEEISEYYILQVGAYQNYDNVIKSTRNFENYIIFEEDNLYKIFIGITKDLDLYEKLENIYSNNSEIFKKTIRIKDEELDKTIDNFDKVITKTNNKNELNLLIKEELKILEKTLNK